MTQRKKPGRPPRATTPATERIELRITPSERRAWEKAAGDLTLSEWIRQRCNIQRKDRTMTKNTHGTLRNHKTGEAVRPATASEQEASRAAAERDGGAGVILVDGMRCYVED